MLDLNWYKTLIAPPFTPPAQIFAPAWTFLYITIFISLVLYITKRDNRSKMWGYILFFSQMVLNLIWTPVFFGFKNIGLALALIVILDILIVLNIKEFFEISKPAAYFLVPYLVWVLFATYLNAGFLMLN